MNSFGRMRDLILSLSLVAIVLFGACSDDVNDRLPKTILTFVNKYFPNSPVSSYTETNSDGYKVTIRNGAVIEFDSAMNWISVNGEGVPLPSMMIMDECPDPLYRYILEMERTDGVYAMTRDEKIYRVEFLDTYILYTIRTGEITYPQAK